MQISISNILGSNTRVSSSTERYYLTDCVELVGDRISTDYPTGTFQISDRVTYDVSGYASFGIITSTTTDIGDDVVINSTGINDVNCLDNQLQFYSDIYREDDNFKIDFYCTPLLNDFDGTDSDYALHFYYYYQIYYTWNDGDNDALITITGSIFNDNYYFYQGNNDIFGNDYVNLGVIPDSWSIENGYDTPSFNNTQGYTQNDCDYSYFMRTNGYTFNASFNSGC